MRSKLLEAFARKASEKVVYYRNHDSFLCHKLAPGSNGHIAELAIEDIEAWYQEHVELPFEQRLAKLGVPSDFARELWPAVAMVRHLAQSLSLTSVSVPQLRLRDGLLADFMPGALGPHYLSRDNLLSEAKAMQARYGMDKAYGKNTGDLAVQLFDQMESLHGLGSPRTCLVRVCSLRS